MPRTMHEVMADLPEAEREKVAERAAELIGEEMSLRRLRKALGQTQTAVAKRLKTGQDAVSKIESRGDMNLSTLRDFIEAIGGELELIARFPGHAPVRLEGLGVRPARPKAGSRSSAKNASSQAAQ